MFKTNLKKTFLCVMAAGLMVPMVAHAQAEQAKLVAWEFDESNNQYTDGPINATTGTGELTFYAEDGYTVTEEDDRVYGNVMFTAPALDKDLTFTAEDWVDASKHAEYIQFSFSMTGYTNPQISFGLAADSGTSLYGLLCRIYQKYGYYKESLVSIVKKGKDGLEEIGRMMSSLRKSPFSEICGFPVAKVVDYKDSLSTGLPESDVLRFFCSNGMTVSARPSGTEPKIKFYFGVKGRSCDDASCLLEKAEKHVLENLP